MSFRIGMFGTEGQVEREELESVDVLGSKYRITLTRCTMQIMEDSGQEELSNGN